MTGGVLTGEICNVTVTDGDAVNAGTYTAQAAPDNHNYTVSGGGISGGGTMPYTVKKAKLTARYDGAKLIYKDAIPEAARHVTVTGFVNGETESGANVAAGYVAPTVTLPVITDTDPIPNDYPLTPSGGSADNYEFDYIAGTLKVLARSFNAVVAQDYTGDYDGQPHGILIENTDPTVSGAIVKYKKDGNWIDEAPTLTDAGTLNVEFRVSAPGFDTKEGSAVITVNPRKVTPVINGAGTKAYDGTTGVPSGITLGLTGLVDGETLTVSGTLAMADKNVGAGKTVTATNIAIADGTGAIAGKVNGKAGNYILTETTAVKAGAATVTIKELALDWSGTDTDPAGTAYTGTPRNVTATIASGSLSDAGGCQVTVSGGNAVNANSTANPYYTATATLSDQNYAIKHGDESRQYKIHKAELKAKFKDETITFGEIPRAEITVTGFMNGETESGPDMAAGYSAPVISSNGLPAEVGTYSIGLKDGTADNYDFNMRDYGTLTIEPAPIRDISSADYIGVYDGLPHGVKVRTPVSNPAYKKLTVKYYPTEQDANDGTNELTDSQAERTDVCTEERIYYKVICPNYTPVIGTNTITITPKTLVPSVIPGSVQDKVYDGTTATTITGGGALALTGVVTGDAVTVSVTVTFATADAGGDKPVDVAGITLAGADKGNYVLSVNSLQGVLTDAKISPKEVSLDWSGYEEADRTPLVYDGQAKDVTAKVRAADLIAPDTPDTCEVTVRGGGEVNANSATVPSYTATAALANGNYAIKAGEGSKEYTVAKAPLTAAFQDETISFGNKPKLEISVTGWKNGEDATTAAGYTAPTIATVPIPSAVGEYTISLNDDGRADNYTVTRQDGKLTVTKASMTDEIKVSGYDGVYDGRHHGIQIVAPAGATVRYYSDENRTQELAPGGEEKKDAGTYTIYYTVIHDSYADVSGSAKIHIRQKTVTASVIPDAVPGKTYDGTAAVTAPNPARDMLTLDGLIAGDGVRAEGTFRFVTADAGQRKTVNVSGIALSGAAAGNYVLSAAAVTDAATEAEITPKEVTLAWEGDTGLVYSGAAKKVTARIAAGLLAGDRCEVTVSGGNEIQANRGATPHYTAAAALTNRNYAIRAGEESHDYVIGKATLTAGIEDETVSFGKKPKLRLKVEGWVNGENETSASGYIPPAVDPNTVGTDRGTYTVSFVAGTGYADNYEFQLGDGRLTVTDASMEEDVSSSGFKGVYSGEPYTITVIAPQEASVSYYANEEDAKNGSHALSPGERGRTDAGTVTIYYKVTCPNYLDVIGSEPIEILPAKLIPSVAGGSVKSREYDKTTDTEGGLLTLTGVIKGDDVTASGTVTFTTADAGKDKKVNVSGIVLDGAKKNNYELSRDSLTEIATDAEITPREAILIWSGGNKIYDGQPAAVTAAVGNLAEGDVCAVTVKDGAQILPGVYTATAAGLSNPNYSLPAPAEYGYTIESAGFTVGAEPYEGMFDGAPHDGVRLTGTKAGDEVRYSTDGGVTWNKETPRVAAVGDTVIEIKVIRPYHRDYTATVTASVKASPKVTIDAPVFDADDVKKITVGGAVTQGSYPVREQQFEIRKIDANKTGAAQIGAAGWTKLKAGTADGTGKITVYRELLDSLELDTPYELRLTATDTRGNTVSDTLKFRTQPENPPTGAIEGEVTGTGSITVTIEMGNTVVGTITGLHTGDKFRFESLPDGEYNLVAADKDYKITKMVTVKNGKTVTLGVVAIGEKQSTVKIKGEAPPVAVGGLNELFDTDTFEKDSEAKEAVNGGGTVEIRLTADDAKRQKEIQEIEAEIEEQKVGVLVDLSVDMYIMPANGLTKVEKLEEVDSLLTVAVPLPAEAVGKTDYRAFRYHGGVDELTRIGEGDSAVEGSFYVEGRYAYIYSQKFSTYAITYSEPDDSHGGGSGGGGNGRHYTITLKAGDGGRFRPDRPRVPVSAGGDIGIDIIPDEGCRVADVKVDGDSVGAVDYYKFTDVSSDHTLSARFEKGEDTPATEEPGAVPDGSAQDGNPADKTAGGTAGGEESREQADGGGAGDGGKTEDGGKTGAGDTAETGDRAEDSAGTEVGDRREEGNRTGTGGETEDDARTEAGRGGLSENAPKPEDAETAKPFVLLSAILAAASVFSAALAWRRRENGEPETGEPETVEPEDGEPEAGEPESGEPKAGEPESGEPKAGAPESGEPETGSSRHDPVLATGASALAVLIFLLTTGWHGIALANWWTMAVAVLTAAGFRMSFKSADGEAKSSSEEDTAGR